MNETMIYCKHLVSFNNLTEFRDLYRVCVTLENTDNKKFTNMAHPKELKESHNLIILIHLHIISPQYHEQISN